MDSQTAAGTLFEFLKKEATKGVKGSFQLNIKKNKKVVEHYWMEITAEGVGYARGKRAQPCDTTITIEDKDLMDSLAGKLNPMQLFTTGKVKIKGNVMALAQMSGGIGSGSGGGAPKQALPELFKKFPELEKNIKAKL